MSDTLRNMNVADIIKASMENRPVDVETAFNGAIQSKMMAAIDAKREEITSSLYGDDSDDDIDVEDTSAESDETEFEETNNEEQTDEDL